MRLLHADANTEALEHEGVRYETDEHGAFDLPHDLAQKLLEGFSHLWSIAPDLPPAVRKANRGKGSKPARTEPEQSPDEGSDDKAEDGDNSKTEDPAQEDQAPADGSEEGDGGDAPARASSAKRAPSRRASS